MKSEKISRHEWETCFGDTIIVEDKQIIWKRTGCACVNYWCSEVGSAKVLVSEILNLVSQVATLKAELDASKTREDVLKQTLENAKEVAIQAIELGRFRLLTQVEDNILKGTKAGTHWIANHDRALVLQSVMPELSAFIRGLDTATGVSE